VPDDVTALSAAELLDAFARRTLDPVEVADATLARIDLLEPRINAFVTVTAERARADAQRASAAWADGTAGPLCGVPYSLKDLAVTKGIPTGRGSLVWGVDDAGFDAPVAERLAGAGGVLLGKTTTPEMGWKGDSGNRRNGPCHNPWRHGRTPGGSSGGTAAAAVAGYGPLHQGSDGAGSVRIPASFCGAVGLKPTYGLIAQYPASAVETVSHLGPITRTVADCALMLDVMAGRDERDRTSVDPPCASYLRALSAPLEPLRIAFSPDLGFGVVEPGVAARVAEAADVLRGLGHGVEEVDLGLDDPWSIEETIWDSGMAALHADLLDEVRDLLDPGLVAVIESGLRRSGVEVARAYQARVAWVDRLRLALAGYDLLVCPTLPCVAFAAGDDHPGTVAGRQVTYLGWTTFTYPFNLSGGAALTVPCGFDDGLPVGLQIVGRRFADEQVLRLGAAYEAAVGPFPVPSL
jgi:aspartyl-tRNA(Asn)/glutamyl-tRNA(Gln) amidotransferase subunit A